MRTVLLAFVASLLLAGCASGFLFREETVVLEVATGRWITAGELTQRLLRADYILLGEKHDNAHHHERQREILQALVSRGGRPALALEMLDTDDAAAISRVVFEQGNSAAIARAAKLEAKRWKWDFYSPLTDIALQARLPIEAANLSRARARELVPKGLAGLEGHAAMRVEAAWNAKREAALRDEVVEAHCGKLPDSAIPGMVLAQRARDAVMADVMLRHPRTVLIAGRGHVRGDRGVPIYLRLRQPTAVVVSVGFFERDEMALEEVKAVDYAWPTEVAQRPDPCAAFVVPARLQPPA